MHKEAKGKRNNTKSDGVFWEWKTLTPRGKGVDDGRHLD
jgi:hypothetical protein